MSSTMERRSTRLKAKVAQSVVQVNQSSEAQALVNEDDLGTENILRGKKRKASRVGSAGLAVLPRSKRVKEVLTQLLEMPLDVLFEVPYYIVSRIC
jgi:hypothetical protein